MIYACGIWRSDAERHIDEGQIFEVVIARAVRPVAIRPLFAIPQGMRIAAGGECSIVVKRPLRGSCLRSRRKGACGAERSMVVEHPSVFACRQSHLRDSLRAALRAVARLHAPAGAAPEGEAGKTFFTIHSKKHPYGCFFLLHVPLPHRPGGAYRSFFGRTCAGQKISTKGIGQERDMCPFPEAERFMDVARCATPQPGQSPDLTPQGFQRRPWAADLTSTTGRYFTAPPGAAGWRRF